MPTTSSTSSAEHVCKSRADLKSYERQATKTDESEALINQNNQKESIIYHFLHIADFYIHLCYTYNISATVLSHIL